MTRRRREIHYHIYDDHMPGNTTWFWWKPGQGWIDFNADDVVGPCSSWRPAWSFKQAYRLAMRMKRLGGKPVILRRYYKHGERWAREYLI
jgi:hypothetical protein